MILRAIVSIFLYVVGIVMVQYIYAKDAGYNKKEMEEILKYFVVCGFFIGVFASFMRGNPVIPLLTNTVVTFITLNKKVTNKDISLLLKVPFIGSIIKDVRDLKFGTIYEVLYRAERGNTLRSFFNPKHIILGNKSICKTCYLTLINTLFFDVAVLSLMGWDNFFEKNKLLILYKYGESMISTVIVALIAGMISYIIIEKRVSPPNEINPEEKNSVKDFVHSQYNTIRSASVGRSFLQVFVILFIGCYCVYASCEIKKGQEKQKKAKFYERVGALNRERATTGKFYNFALKENKEKTVGEIREHELYGKIYVVKGEMTNGDPRHEAFPKICYELSYSSLEEGNYDTLKIKAPIFFSKPIEDKIILSSNKEEIDMIFQKNRYDTRREKLPFTSIFYDLPDREIGRQYSTYYCNP